MLGFNYFDATLTGEFSEAMAKFTSIASAITLPFSRQTFVTPEQELWCTDGCDGLNWATTGYAMVKRREVLMIPIMAPIQGRDACVPVGTAQPCSEAHGEMHAPRREAVSCDFLRAASLRMLLEQPSSLEETRTTIA